MSRLKIPLGTDVLTAARQRIADVFDHFPRIYVSFSGGKDSTVLLHLTADEARKRGRRFGLLFIDWEAQYRRTVDHVAACIDLCADCADPYWIALPLKTPNACSMTDPEWTCWQPERRADWVREPPACAITDTAALPFHRAGITFEEFVPEFGAWYGGGVLTACLVGIRAAESLNRFRTLAMRGKQRFRGHCWTTFVGRNVFNAYPIYDWRTEDVWTYHGKTGRPYNTIYDLMHKAGLTPHQMRICEPYGPEQRRGLWLYHILEPETWGRVAARVAGANSASLYCGERGNIQGNVKVTLPDGHTWESFAKFLLSTMPDPTAQHYLAKIARYCHYCMSHLGYPGGIPDSQPGDTGGKDVPSWRRVCKVLLRNDYWCRQLSFSPTKSHSYEAYIERMKERRHQWKII